MDRGVRRDAGGIAGLVGVLRDHREAIEYDLLRIGLRLDHLGTRRLTWRDLLVMVRKAQPESALYKSMNPQWQRTHELSMLQSMEFTLRWLQWAKTSDGHNGRNVPEPSYLPWDDRPDDGSIRGDVMDVDEAADWLGWTAEISAHMGT